MKTQPNKNIDTYGKFTEPETLRFERLLPGPIERVWDYLTKSELRGKWLASGSMDLREGGNVKLVFNHQNLTPHDDPIPEKYKEQGEVSTMHGKVTRIDPPRLISFTWAETQGESEVTFELTPKGENVLLELTHQKIGDDREMLLEVSAGWHTHLDIMTDKLNGREPKPFWAKHIKLEEEYEKKLDT